MKRSYKSLLKFPYTILYHINVSCFVLVVRKNKSSLLLLFLHCIETIFLLHYHQGYSIYLLWLL